LAVRLCVSLRGVVGTGHPVAGQADQNAEPAAAPTANRGDVQEPGVNETTGVVARRDRSLVFVSKRQVSGTSTYAATLMDQLASMLWHSGDAPDLPDSFWVGLQAAWCTAHAETVVGPLLWPCYG
jgi:hypothetical protein